ncbi:sialin-like isoform X2 [Planococcus citri]
MNPKVNNQSIQLEVQQEKLLTPPASQPSPLWFSKRFFVAVMLAVCHLNSSFSRFNISIALVEMTYSKQIKNGNLTETQLPEFDWDANIKGLILSIFYYGGLVSFLGSYFVSKIGGANCCALTMMSSGIITLFHPISLQYSFFLFLVCRFVVGISESLLVVSIFEVSSQWTPKNERSQLVSISTTGVNIGLAIVHGVCAFVAFNWGWRMIFYVTGSISLITSSVCFILMKNRPSDDKRISKRELSYIQERITTVPPKKVRHPYMKIISSAAVWALLVVKFAVVTGMTFISTFLPMYVKDITHKDINEVGIISSLPNILNIFMLPVWGILLDYGKSINISVTLMHKIIIGGSFILIGVLFASAALISNFTVSIISFLLIQTLLFLIGLVSQ